MMLRTLTALTTLVIGIALVSAGQLGAAPAQTAAASQVGRDGEQATPHGRAAGEALVPESHHARLSLETVEHLTRHHFVRRPIDDRLSSQVFDKYIEALDPQRLYFLAADLKDFETYRLSLDDALQLCQDAGYEALTSPSTSTTKSTGSTPPGPPAPRSTTTCGASD